MNRLLKTKYFLIPYLLMVSVFIVLMLIYSKVELHLLLAQHRSIVSDYFFVAFTEVGGTLPYVFIACLFFYRYSAALYLITAQFFGGILSLVLKHIIDAPRPKLYFETFYPDTLLPHVDGFRLYSTHSMPSGHTITAFALFFGLSLLIKNKRAQFFCFIAALLVGYSRVYLSQHFSEDVLAGSLIGIFAAWVCFPLYRKWDKKWGKSSLRDLRRKPRSEERKG